MLYNISINTKGEKARMNSIIQMLSNSKKFNSYIEDIKDKKSPGMLTRTY